MTFQKETYCLYHQKYYKLICIGLSRQTNWTIQQKVNFMGKYDEYHGVTIFFVAVKEQNTILSLALD